MTSSNEYDALFYTALRLLHSKSKSSTEQLKMLLDDALAAKGVDLKVDANKQSNKKPIEKLSIKLIDESNATKRSLIDRNHAASKFSELPKKRAKIQSTASSRSNSPESKSNEKDLKGNKPKIIITKQETDDSSKTDSDDTDVDDSLSTGQSTAGELVIEMGLACVICKQLDFTSSNQQIECSECHNLYHQECHKPPVTNSNINDPRFIWYCGKCTKNLEKASKQSKTIVISSNKPKIKKEPISSLSIDKNDLEKSKSNKIESSSSAIQPFKRIESKIPQSPGTSGKSGDSPNISKPIGPNGLAKFFANFDKKPSTSQNPPASSVGSQMSVTYSKADKMIQQMRKKAAAKKLLRG